jgi:hypothetical protein
MKCARGPSCGGGVGVGVGVGVGGGGGVGCVFGRFFLITILKRNFEAFVVKCR